MTSTDHAAVGPFDRRDQENDRMDLPGWTCCRAIRRLAGAATALLAVVALVGPAQAHEQRDVAGYGFEVGFVGEPIYVGQRSGLEVHVTKGGQPVAGLEATLNAEVILGDAQRDLPLAARKDEPGWYESVFIPTVAGRYTFHLTGSVDGDAIDESFTSSPTGIDEVQETSAGQFPVAFPTVAELAAQARKGADAAALVPVALALGGGGLIVGLLGLGIGLAGRRRSGD
jgi:hypothetical protein